MSRRSQRQDAAELRDRFIANREKVRSWISGWDCPEVEWPAFRAIPSPWVVSRGDEQNWLEHQAPFLDEYSWLLQARPVAEGVGRVVVRWQFGAGHRFDLLEIDMRCYADPGYLAEKLALGAHAAELKGWRQEDLQGLYEWLFEGVDSRPMGQAVRGQQRIGFLLFELLRTPYSNTEIDARLRITLTGTTLTGTPLTSTGEPP